MTRAARARSGLIPAVLVCAVAGVATAVAALVYDRSGASATAVGVPLAATEDYGRRLIAETAALLGPDHADPAMRYSGSRLACGSCHLGAGLEPGTLSLLPAAEHYPRFSPRAGAMTDVEDRINECMQRSMNGRALPFDSVEMQAMATYIRSLGKRYAAMGAGQRAAVEPPPFKVPDRAADLAAGKTVFDARCAICHGGDGLGLRASVDLADGYVFPPLWGPDSFNDGAGLHRLLTAARFVKARMPLGNADLTSDQAFDVAAYINAQPRPEMANLDRDYADLKAKPVDNTYGPFADEFPLEQHRFGPFAPIEAYYKALKAKQ
ncbi:MAG: c-type cytochrome [Gammaproteobacteria bacterium]